MIRDFRLNTLINNIVNSINGKKYSIYKDWVNKYNELSNNLKEDLVISIYKHQEKDITTNCKNKLESYLSYLGVFKIKKGRNIALSIKSNLIKENGYSDWDSVPDYEKIEILEKTEELKRESLILHKKQRNVIKEGNKTKVLYFSNLIPKKKI